MVAAVVMVAFAVRVLTKIASLNASFSHSSASVCLFFLLSL